MISSTFGAPLGGSTRGGQYGFDCAALRSILPPNFGGGGGAVRPSIVIVAAGEPGAPLICWALVGSGESAIKDSAETADNSALMRPSIHSLWGKAQKIVPIRHCQAE